jgi:hypothetical protein
MKRSILIVTGALALVLGPGAAAFAATPSSIAVSPTATSDTWTGVSFLAGATASPSLCPASVDPTNSLCDHVSLDVGVTSGYWDSHTGGARVTISWSDASDNFDVYVYNSAGTQVGQSIGTGTSSESVDLTNAAGGYEIRVVPVLVTSSGYTGKATFSSQATTTASPTPTSTSSSGTSGGTSGSGSSGTGSSTGTSSGSSSTSTGTSGASAIQGPVPHYTIGSYGGSAPGGLFYAPYPGSAGQGGTTSFGSVSRKVSYASTYGGPVSAAVADQAANDRNLGSTIARTTWLLWLLLALGLALLALVAYVIVEPEGDSDRVVAIGEARARLPVPPYALAGGVVRALATGGSVLARFGRAMTGRPRRA